MKEIEIDCPFKEITVDGEHIIVYIPLEDTTFCHKGYQFIVVEFCYPDCSSVKNSSKNSPEGTLQKLVKQGFYCSTGMNSGIDYGQYSKGTWFPCNGIKHLINKETNLIQSWIDKLPFQGDTDFSNKIYTRLGDEYLAKVSYTLGGGIWIYNDFEDQDDEKITNIKIIKRQLNIPPNQPRCCFLDLQSEVVSPRIINEFINEAVSLNYYNKSSNYWYSSDSLQVRRYLKGLNKDKVSALDFIHRHPSGYFYVPEQNINKWNLEWYTQYEYPRYDKLQFEDGSV